jgi:hypothetical protein
MKKILILCLIALEIVFTSCKKENNYQNNEQTIEQICGAYNIQHDIISANIGTDYWSIGLENLTISKDSLLFIDRISNNKIKTYGLFNTIGTINEDRIIFESIEFINNTCFNNYYDLSEIIYDSMYVKCDFNDAYYSNGVININLNVLVNEKTNRIANYYNQMISGEPVEINIENNYKIIGIQIRNYGKQQ